MRPIWRWLVGAGLLVWFCAAFLVAIHWPATGAALLLGWLVALFILKGA